MLAWPSPLEGWSCAVLIVPSSSLCVALALAPARADAITLREIMELTRAGLSDDVLLALIEVDQRVFPIDPATLKMLKDAGVSRDGDCRDRQERAHAAAAARAVRCRRSPPIRRRPQVVVVDRDPVVREVPCRAGARVRGCRRSRGVRAPGHAVRCPPSPFVPFGKPRRPAPPNVRAAPNPSTGVGAASSGRMPGSRPAAEASARTPRRPDRFEPLRTRAAPAARLPIDRRVYAIVYSARDVL